MELMAAIIGLEALREPCEVTLYSDSQYVVDNMDNSNAAKWKARGWRLLSSNKPVKNPDLWDRLLFACAEHEVKFVWVPGHSGHVENERCDKLAFYGLRDTVLQDDVGYVESIVVGNGEMELAFDDE